MIEIELNMKGDGLLVRTPPSQENISKARAIPSRRWLKASRVWKCAPSLANIQYLDEAWPDAEWSSGALSAKKDAIERAAMREATLLAKEDGDLSSLEGIPFKHPPFEHQARALLLGRDCESFAYLMDQGTGKTKVDLDDTAHNWREDRIDLHLIIAPNSVKTNWVNIEGSDEVGNHMAPDIEYVKGVWFSTPNAAQKKHFNYFLSKVNDPRYLKVLAINVESLAVPRVQDFLINLCNAFRVKMTIDESTRIGNPTAKRTKFALRLGKMCVMRRILTGTPVVKSPVKAFSQFKFLDPDILGQDSFYSFRNRYCIMGGFEGRQVLSYKNMDELSARIASCSFRVLKDDCLDLPPKVYQRRNLKLSAAQSKVYKQMREDAIAIIESQTVVTAPIVLTQRLRLQQIVGGYLPKIDEFGDTIDVVPIIEPKNNPKIQEVIALIEEAGDQKVIVWCRFRAEIEGIISELQRHEISCVPFHGGVSEADRVRNREAFQGASEPQVLVGNAAAGGIGLNFYRASVAIYFSNSHDTEDRVQSEDRCHRIGSGIHDCVTYYDLVCTGTVDIGILAVLRNNKQISNEIMGDGWREWI